MKQNDDELECSFLNKDEVYSIKDPKIIIRRAQIYIDELKNEIEQKEKNLKAIFDEKYNNLNNKEEKDQSYAMSQILDEKHNKFLEKKTFTSSDMEEKFEKIVQRHETKDFVVSNLEKNVIKSPMQSYFEKTLDFENNKKLREDFRRSDGNIYLK
jgi:hypothetical protein